MSSVRSEAREDGAFVRQTSRFRRWVGTAPYDVDTGRYHLYVARACPWAHRTIIARRLMGLDERPARPLSGAHAD